MLFGDVELPGEPEEVPFPEGPPPEGQVQVEGLLSGDDAEPDCDGAAEDEEEKLDRYEGAEDTTELS